jgi:hypothetical protein
MMDKEEKCLHMKLGEGNYLRNAGALWSEILKVIDRMRRKKGI